MARQGWAGGSRIGVQGTADTSTAPVEDVGVDHGGGDVAVAEELLDGSDVVAALEEVGREGMAKRVAGRPLRQTGAQQGLRDPGRAVERRVVEPCVGVLWSQG